ncbi:MAG: alpha/beta fold hydrolase [Deltaproteobacteria bacterium]|nr:alpha/beta fold hydrolase [Deltaproteobacteria bacterium]
MVHIILVLGLFIPVNGVFAEHEQTTRSIKADEQSTRVIDSTLFDSARLEDAKPRAIPIRIYVPVGSGPFPVIVFSHGLGGTKEQYEYLLRAWAEAGYLVVTPTHAGSDYDALWSNGRDMVRLRFLAIISSEKQRANRARDVSFILDSLPTLEKKFPELAKKIDMKHVGAAGHSFGAHTSLALAGANVHFKDKPPKLADPRVVAAIAISPPGVGTAGFQSDSWSTISVPVLSIRGQKDNGVRGQPPQWRDGPYQGMPSDNKKCHAIVQGQHADHMFFLGEQKSVDKKKSLDDVTHLTVAFWNSVLKEKQQQSFPDKAVTFSSSRMDISCK